MTEIKQTITKGQAVDIADAELFNEQVKAVDYAGQQARYNSSRTSFKPRKEVLDRASLNNTISVDNIYGYGDEYKTSLYVDGDRHGEGVRVVGYAAQYDKEDRRREKTGGFTIYFDSEEQIIDFAERCLDTLAVKKEKGYLFKQYDGGHPDMHNHFPNLLERTMCETGRYYWDGSLNKVVEITKDTPQEVLEMHPHYDTDDEGNFEQDYWNERAEDKLKGLETGASLNWQGEEYMGINLSNLLTGGYYKDGYYAAKVRDPQDKRKKMWLTTFFYQDGTEVSLEGNWSLLDTGVLRRITWNE